MKMISCLLLVICCVSARRVPGGADLPEECVHQLDVESAHMVEVGDELHAVDDEGNLLKVIPPCLALQDRKRAAESALSGGYMAWLTLSPPAMTLLVSSWAVPQNPPQTSGTDVLFLWNGVQPILTGGGAVIQPVLQYGRTEDGGGRFWSVACWYVSESHGAVYTQAEKLNTNDVIIGYNFENKPGPMGNSWTAVAHAHGKNLTLTHQTFTRYTTAFIACEMYDANGNCQLYPNAPQVFYDIRMNVGAPYNWQPQTGNTQCGEHAKSLNSDGTKVEIAFHSD